MHPVRGSVRFMGTRTRTFCQRRLCGFTSDYPMTYSVLFYYFFLALSLTRTAHWIRRSIGELDLFSRVATPLKTYTQHINVCKGITLFDFLTKRHRRRSHCRAHIQRPFIHVFKGIIVYYYCKSPLWGPLLKRRHLIKDTRAFRSPSIPTINSVHSVSIILYLYLCNYYYNTNVIAPVQILLF